MDTHVSVTPTNGINTNRLITICHHFILPLLFFIPLYYSSQASALWLNNLDTDRVRRLSDALGISNIIYNGTDVSRPAAVHFDAGPTRGASMTEPFDVGIERAVDNPLRQLQSRWKSYIDSRCAEWAFIGSSAAAIAIALLTVLQIAGVHDHPLTRNVIFLAIFRTMAALAHSLVLLFFFRQVQSRTSNFANIWKQYVRQNKTSFIYTPWTFLAQPAVNLSWAVMLLLLALLHHIWYTTFASGLDTVAKVQLWADFVLPIVMAVSTALDVACIIWAIKTLRELMGGIPRDFTAVPFPGSNDHMLASLTS